MSRLRRFERRMLELLSEYQHAFERGPSIAELARISMLARTEVSFIIGRLELRGFVRRVAHKPRRYELICGPAPRGTISSPTPAAFLEELRATATRLLEDP